MPNGCFQLKTTPGNICLSSKGCTCTKISLKPKHMCPREYIARLSKDFGDNSLTGSLHYFLLHIWQESDYQKRTFPYSGYLGELKKKKKKKLCCPSSPLSWKRSD